jgi:hypothetical protein
MLSLGRRRRQQAFGGLSATVPSAITLLGWVSCLREVFASQPYDITCPRHARFLFDFASCDNADSNSASPFCDIRVGLRWLPKLRGLPRLDIVSTQGFPQHGCRSDLSNTSSSRYQAEAS